MHGNEKKGGASVSASPTRRVAGEDPDTPARGAANLQRVAPPQTQGGMAETRRDRRAQRHSAARVARGRASSRSGTRSARGYGGGGAPDNAQPPALTQGASQPASVASGLASACNMFKGVHFVGCNNSVWPRRSIQLLSLYIPYHYNV